MSKTIGLIAEDKSDIDVIHEILKKYLKFGSFRVKNLLAMVVVNCVTNVILGLLIYLIQDVTLFLFFMT